MAAELVELIAGDEPGAWERLGFAVDATGACRIGGVVVRLAGGGGGLRSWVLRGPGGPGSVDGLPTAWTTDAGPEARPPEHPNGAIALDHVVVLTDDRERTALALESVGGDVRRRRDPPVVPLPMAFVRFGEAIVEVAQPPLDKGPGPLSKEAAAARFWGLVAIVGDLDACADRLGDLLGTVRPAVQPGRRIATVRRDAGLGVALAFMSADPRPRSSEGGSGAS